MCCDALRNSLTESIEEVEEVDALNLNAVLLLLEKVQSFIRKNFNRIS